MAKPQKGAADAAARLIAKYGKAAVSSAVRNFKPAKKVKVTGTKMTTGPKSNVKKITKEQYDDGKWSMTHGIGKHARKTKKNTYKPKKPGDWGYVNPKDWK